MSFTFLIVDDSATTRAIIKRTIAMSGVPTKQVLEAPDGAAALKIIKETPIDLGFFDINMPNMTGIELTQKLRADADARVKNTPVVIVSSESTASRIEQLRAQGIQGYIKKPFTPEQIRDVVNATMGVRNAA
jgi:two-component system, chemotaxis family, chemotaxis protein CheY